MRSTVVLLIAILFAVVSCTQGSPKESPPPPPAGWPAELDGFSFVWTAEPGIDLVADGAAVAARAYVESYFLAVLTENDKYLYPGFADAVDPDQSSGPPGTEKLHPELGHSGSDVYIGTARHHVLSIARSDRDVTLTACAFTYGSAIEHPAGKYNAIVGEGVASGPGIYPFRIGLRVPDGTYSEMPPQQGPARTPFDNVFGGWKITNHQGGFLVSTVRWPEYDRDRATCTEKADMALSNRHLSPIIPYPRSDFPMLPATPGWPAKPAS
ncbi:MAG: hypothetical protein QOH20_3892 [Mycobacterium sp.]|jgi:hypothetical protein|nr:hypothetical protein [Mycobacterium sp.]